MLSNKYKSMLALHGIDRKDMADSLGILRHTLSQKIQKNQWTLKDIVVLANQTNSKICLVDNETKQIVMEIKEDDIGLIK